MLKVDTIGNATLIAYDQRPLLVTDPWLDEHSAYFGSWGLDYEIPPAQREAMLSAEYVWFSHGHPDHLNPDSVKLFKNAKILIADHRGQRILTGLQEEGYDVEVLKDRQWTRLSENVRIMSIADYIQDSILLVDVGGTLFMNFNDAGVRYCRKTVKAVASEYSRVFMLKLSGYGDADMINIFDEGGRRIPPAAAERPPVGSYLEAMADTFGATDVVPFSSFHRYQRSDSIWAQAYATPISAYREGWRGERSVLHDPFISYDASTASVTPIEPKPAPEVVYEPEVFGDNWSDQLETEDLALIKNYFGKIERLKEKIGFLEFVVGGCANRIVLSSLKNGITFESPRNSLIEAVKYEIFDDLLIGNFAKTTFHGVSSLYEPNFNLLVCKLADNGRAKSKSEVREYMRDYRSRGEGEWLREEFANLTARYLRPAARKVLPQNTGAYQALVRINQKLR